MKIKRIIALVVFLSFNILLYSQNTYTDSLDKLVSNDYSGIDTSNIWVVDYHFAPWIKEYYKDSKGKILDFIPFLAIYEKTSDSTYRKYEVLSFKIELNKYEDKIVLMNNSQYYNTSVIMAVRDAAPQQIYVYSIYFRDDKQNVHMISKRFKI